MRTGCEGRIPAVAENCEQDRYSTKERGAPAGLPNLFVPAAEILSIISIFNTLCRKNKFLSIFLGGHYAKRISWESFKG